MDLDIVLQVVTDLDFLAWVVVPALLVAAVVRPGRTGRQVASLRDVANALGGVVVGGAPFGAGAAVVGCRLDGREVDLRMTQGSARSSLRSLYTLGLREPRPELVVTRLEGAGGLVIQGGQLSARTRAVVTELLAPGDSLTIRRDRMTLELWAFEPQRAVQLLATLSQLAGAAVALEATPRVDLRGRESAAHCPWCRDALDPAALDAVACAVCATRHHGDCFELASGCTVFACAGAPRRARSGVR